MKIKMLFRRQTQDRQARPEPAPRRDLERLAIERLASLGTELRSVLAMEIQRSIERRNDCLR